MVKLVYCLRRRADISPEEFYRYWLNTHGPKVKNAAEALRALRYVRSHTCAAELNQAFVAWRQPTTGSRKSGGTASKT